MSEGGKTEAASLTTATSNKQVKKTEAELPYPVRILRASANPDKNNTENNNDSKQQ